MTFKRKYQFNGLDHLYYTGKGGTAVWSMWFYIECFFVLPPLILLLLCTVVMAMEQMVNTVLVISSICAACALAVVLFSKRLLENAGSHRNVSVHIFADIPGENITPIHFTL